MPKIMLAEDDLTMVSLLKTLLRMDGYQVLTLEGDEDVFSAVQRDRPDVLILDVHLSRVNGLEVLEQIRAAEDTKDVNVLMTSGLSLEKECKQRGANNFLLKPFMPDELLGLLSRMLSTS